MKKTGKKRWKLNVRLLISLQVKVPLKVIKTEVSLEAKLLQVVAILEAAALIPKTDFDLKIPTLPIY